MSSFSSQLIVLLAWVILFSWASFSLCRLRIISFSLFHVLRNVLNVLGETADLPQDLMESNLPPEAFADPRFWFTVPGLLKLVENSGYRSTDQVRHCSIPVIIQPFDQTRRSWIPFYSVPCFMSDSSPICLLHMSAEGSEHQTSRISAPDASLDG